MQAQYCNVINPAILNLEPERYSIPYLHCLLGIPSVRITTKQHLLEDHAMDWIIQYQFGFGLFGEQGMESIHHKIRRLADNHHGIINPLQRLKATIQEHHLHTYPEMKSITGYQRKKLMTPAFSKFGCNSKFNGQITHFYRNFASVSMYGCKLLNNYTGTVISLIYKLW